MGEFFKKNWLVILVGFLSAFLMILTLLTAEQLKKATPVAPTVPKKKPEAVVPACTLSFKLVLSLSPTPTPVELATSAVEINKPPVCNELTAQPTSGEAPLKVTFTGSGFDSDGKVTAFEFSFGDGEKKIIEKDTEGEAGHSLNHTYFSAGSYLASLRVQDDKGLWSDTPESCKVKIEVKEGVVGGEESTFSSKEIAQAPTATSTPIPLPKVPEAGIALPTILTILSGALLILLGTLL